MEHVLEIFHKGGPIMWPLLLCSLVALTVVFERLLFEAYDLVRRDGAALGKVLGLVERGQWADAEAAAKASRDPVVCVLAAGLEMRSAALTATLQRSAEKCLLAYARGLTVLDTIITAAPLLGLLGTVTGMIHAFSLLGGSELGAPSAITGGIAEALIATAFGLSIAILALIPFNYLHGRLERIRHRLQDACTAVEIAASASRTQL
jgi:biopolymer transport protein ExbB